MAILFFHYIWESFMGYPLWAHGEKFHSLLRFTGSVALTYSCSSLSSKLVSRIGLHNSAPLFADWASASSSIRWNKCPPSKIAQRIQKRNWNKVYHKTVDGKCQRQEVDYLLILVILWLENNKIFILNSQILISNISKFQATHHKKDYNLGKKL